MFPWEFSVHPFRHFQVFFPVLEILKWHSMFIVKDLAPTCSYGICLPHNFLFLLVFITLQSIVSANKQHTAGYLMGDLYLYSRGGQLIFPRGSLGNWDCCGGPHQQAFKVIKLILSKIEFSLLVLPSTTVPVSHVAPLGKLIDHPCVVTSSINNLLLEYINLQRSLSETFSNGHVTTWSSNASTQSIK